METETVDLTEELNLLFKYLDQIYKNGEIDLFSSFFQSDFRILNYLRAHPGSHPSIIADELGITRPNVAANLRILEEQGLIERTIDKKNRRQIYVNATPKAEAVMHELFAKLGRLFVNWFKILGEEETKHLFKILELSSNPSILTDEIKNYSFNFDDVH